MDEILFDVKSESLTAVSGLQIEANFDECKAALTEMMKPYRGMVVTEDGISAAKADRARIRKIIDRIDEARKTVKAAYSAPLAAFEARCKELTSICADASSNLDGQVKAFDQQKRDEKLLRIRAYFDELAHDVAPYLTWETVMDARWGNATYPMDKAMREVKEAVVTCQDDLTTIRRMESPFESALLDLYRTSHSLAACIRKQQELTALREQEDRRKRAEQEKENQRNILAQMREDARRNALKYENPDHERIMAQEAAREAAAQVEEPAQAVTQTAAEKVFELDFRCYVTLAQMNALRQFMVENGIRFGRVPTEHEAYGH